MDDPKLSEAIIKRLSEGNNRDDIILDICEKNDMAWTEAEALIEQVHTEQTHEITKRQFPLLFVIALAVFIGGAAITAYAIFTTVSLFEAYVSRSRMPLEFADALFTFFQFAWEMLSIAAVGIAMLLGSLLGMKRAWAEVLQPG